MTDICLEFKNLTLGYQSHAAVRHLSGTADRGVLTAIVGANGSGKSTLMKGIAGILKPLNYKRRSKIRPPSPISFAATNASQKQIYWVILRKTNIYSRGLWSFLRQHAA